MAGNTLKDGQALRRLMLGLKVERATDNILTGDSLFTIAGGRVLMTYLIGEVTTIIETKTVNFKISLNPTTGTTTDLCANLDLSADEAGALYTISGVGGTAMQRAESGNAVGQLYPVALAIGTIDATVGATHTGSIKWTLFYVPIDNGAYVTAAAGA